MNWTEPKPPTDNISYYDHVLTETPLGKIMIEWKSWKDTLSYDITLDDEWLGVEYDLNSAKQKAEDYLKEKYYVLQEFLGLKQKLTDIRNRLYDSLPIGEVNDWNLSKIIGEHLNCLDNFIDNK